MTALQLATPYPSAGDWLAARHLEHAVRGTVLVPGDDEYDAERATWSGAVRSRPVAIALADSAADVRAALAVARDHDLPFAVQSTGHGTSVACDGGILVKTAAMSEVLIDPARRTARVGAGTRWGEVIAAAAPLGLAPISGSAASVGVAGYTLGGGVGWLSRRYGFAADSLVSAEVVTAGGELVTASADEHADLFWALRGGGANFGVVTSMEIRLHPAARVYGGSALFPLARAAGLLAALRDQAATQPDELNVAVVLLKDASAQGVAGPAVLVRGVHTGAAADAERALQPLWAAAGAPLANDFRPMDYASTGALGGTAPRAFQLHEDLPDALVDAAVEAVAQRTVNAIEVRHWGGAMADPDGGPVGHRDVPFSLTIDGEPGPALRRDATGGSFLNFLHDPAMTHAAYTPADLRRLQDVKRAWDPDNVLGLTHNIPPARHLSVVENPSSAPTSL